MTFEQLKQKVSFLVDDLNEGYFTDDQLNRFVNDAQFEVQKMLNAANENYHVICVETQCIVNQADYILPDNFLKINRLEVVQGAGSPGEDRSPVQFITINQQDFFSTSPGFPLAYFIRKNRIVLNPMPDSTAYRLRLYYTYRVDEMTLPTDLPDIPEQYHELISIMAAIDCFIKDGRDASLLVEKKKKYEEMMAQDADERNIDGPRTIVVTENGGVGGFY